MFDEIRAWIDGTRSIDWYKVIMPILAVILGVLLYGLAKSITKRIFERSRKSVHGQGKQRVDTICALVTNIEKYIAIIVVLIIILSIFGIDVTSLLAGLGIMTAIVGLAFQDLAKDIIAGISIVTENQFDVGDDVKINDFRGKVISLGLKTTKIQNYRGHILSIPNHNISQVTNFSDANTTAEVSVGVSYKHKSEEVEKALMKVKANIEAETDKNVKEMQIDGITDLADSAVIWRVSMECKAGTSVGVERKIRREIKEVFDKEGIEIPYPQVTVSQKIPLRKD